MPVHKAVFEERDRSGNTSRDSGKNASRAYFSARLQVQLPVLHLVQNKSSRYGKILVSLSSSLSHTHIRLTCYITSWYELTHTSHVTSSRRLPLWSSLTSTFRSFSLNKLLGMVFFFITLSTLDPKKDMCYFTLHYRRTIKENSFFRAHVFCFFSCFSFRQKIKNYFFSCDWVSFSTLLPAAPTFPCGDVFRLTMKYNRAEWWMDSDGFLQKTQTNQVLSAQSMISLYVTYEVS